MFFPQHPRQARRRGAVRRGGQVQERPNTFTENSFTAPHREQMDALLDSLFDQYVSAIASGRGKTRDEVLGLIDAGPTTGRCVEGGPRGRAALQGPDRRPPPGSRPRDARAGTRGPPAGSASTVARRSRLSTPSATSCLGRARRAPWGAARRDRTRSRARCARLARTTTSRPSSCGWDSPGGFGPAADVIRREVQMARQTKPVSSPWAIWPLPAATTSRSGPRPSWRSPGPSPDRSASSAASSASGASTTRSA
jgi:hypothetical protein